MFGYIRIAKPELKIKEYEMYKAVYCSLCRSLGKYYGVFSRFTLSYDFTFLALLNMSLSDDCNILEKKHCTFNPLKKCNYCKNVEMLEMPSAAAIIMLYYKLKDDITDEKGIKKLLYLTLYPLFLRPFKKASRSHPEIDSIISAYISKQNKLEKAECSSIDEIADPTATALSEILMLCSNDFAQKRILERIGYCLGRYIYLLDAAYDLERDIKNKSYNVLKFGIETENIKEYAKNRVVPQLYFAVNEVGKAFELLDVKKYKSILSNIIYFGLEDTLKKELNL